MGSGSSGNATLVECEGTRILVDAGLLHREKRGTWAYYSLVPGALERTADVLSAL